MLSDDSSPRASFPLNMSISHNTTTDPSLDHDDVSPASKQQQNNYRVVIVGGGIAGIAAAETLRSQQAADPSSGPAPPVLVLEGSDRLGGRARSHGLVAKEDDAGGDDVSVTIEQGANWITGTTPKNPIYSLAMREGITGVEDNETRREGCCDDETQQEVEADTLVGVRVRDAQSGADVTDEFRPCCTKVEAIFRKAETAEVARFEEEDGEEDKSNDEESTGFAADKSVREALTEHGWPDPRGTGTGIGGNDGQTKLEELAEWYNVDYDYADRPENLSVRHNLVGEYTWEDFGGGNFLVTDRRGFGEVLVNGILNGGVVNDASDTNDISDSRKSAPSESEVPLEIRLNSVVVLIEQPTWSTTGVDSESSTSFSVAGTTQKDSKSSVLVHLEDGTVISAEHVIVTASVGMLQSGLLRFEPQLSRSKQEALAHIGMSCYLKCFVHWKTSWLGRNAGEDWKHTLLVNHPCGVRGFWPIVTRMGENDGLLLMMTMTDTEGRRIESLASTGKSDEVVAEVVNVLQRSFPECSVSMPDNFFVSSWSQDRLFRGAYSSLKPGCPPGVFSELQRPEGNVWFAGEACHAKYSGFLQGAYLSGVDTANSVAKLL